jgi:hypothetical protein
MTRASTTAGAANCQIETPAPRMTASSWSRVSRKNVIIAASRMTNGIRSSIVCSSLKVDISSAMSKSSARVAARREISTVSISHETPVMGSSTTPKFCRKRRPI